ncbi:MAG: PDZ domain-containing protein [Verrucomicrobia bacterium]|nr:PDZ domain-containing protein [Verrucomicrobiota bacterium]
MGWVLMGLWIGLGWAAERPGESAAGAVEVAPAARRGAGPAAVARGREAALERVGLAERGAAKPRVLPTAFRKGTPTSISDLKAIERHLTALLARVSAATVALEVGERSGSGVVISADGLVLTAAHVCGESDRDVGLTFPDGSRARGKSLGLNAEADAGLVQITDRRGSWPHLEIGDLDTARVGDWVVALGHPGGFDPRRSLVVRLGRLIGLGTGALRTDCAITAGDSGGPLLDMHGRVLGIHSYISSSTTENFHLPITKYYEVWDQLVTADESPVAAPVARAYLGATGADGTSGCRLEAVEADSPASLAGLQVGDIVVKVNGREILVSASFRRWVAESRPGETLEVEVKRGDQTLVLAVRLGTERSKS